MPKSSIPSRIFLVHEETIPGMAFPDHRHGPLKTTMEPVSFGQIDQSFRPTCVPEFLYLLHFGLAQRERSGESLTYDTLS